MGGRQRKSLERAREWLAGNQSQSAPVQGSFHFPLPLWRGPRPLAHPPPQKSGPVRPRPPLPCLPRLQHLSAVPGQGCPACSSALFLLPAAFTFLLLYEVCFPSWTLTSINCCSGLTPIHRRWRRKSTPLHKAKGSRLACSLHCPRRPGCFVPSSDHTAGTFCPS